MVLSVAVMAAVRGWRHGDAGGECDESGGPGNETYKIWISISRVW